MKEWKKEQEILVAGAGRSGINAVRLLLAKGYRPVLYDGNAGLDREQLKEKLQGDCPILLGELPEEGLKERYQCCVISPGIPLTAPFAAALKQAGVPIISEISLAWRFHQGKLAAVTGTNGKTTTTSLLGHILSAVYPDTFVVGNIGHAWSIEVAGSHPGSATVAEISSFQLETLEEGFAPEVTIITNLTPDHLDRHGTVENYYNLKKSIAAGQAAAGFCVVNREDPLLQDMPGKTKAKVLYFSSARELEEGTFLKDGRLMLRLNGKEEALCETSALRIVGTHNYENAAAASLAAALLGVPTEIIRRQLLSFTAVEHRIEYVCTKNGVEYFNDSKGTNPDAAIKGIEAMTGPTVLLGGGYDKHSDYTDWVKCFKGRVKLLLLMGATARDIADCVDKVCPVPYRFVKDMEEAVAIAKEAAEPGDKVLLSPACASWGMYPDFEVRGRHFKDLVRQ